MLHVCAALIAVAGGLASVAHADACLGLEAEARGTCIEERIGSRPPDPERLAELLAREGWAEPLARAYRLEARSAAIHWYDPDGTLRWSRPLDPDPERWSAAADAFAKAGHEEATRALARWAALGLDETRPASDPRALIAERWAERLEGVSFPALGGGSIELDSVEAPAVLLDFWATWCGPCRQELPHLESLAKRLKDRGLAAWAINAEEPDDVIRAYVSQLGLTLPVGKYSESVDDSLGIRTLPTVILLDREKRVRRRWDGYVRGLETQIAREAEALLAEPGGPFRPAKVADVLSDGLGLRTLWYRAGGSRIEGLAVDPASGHTVVARERDLTLIARDGSLAGGIQADLRLGRPLAGDLDGDGFPEVVGWNVGSRDVTAVKVRAGEYTTWQAPSPLLDAAIEPSANGAPGALRLATLEGEWNASLGGDRIEVIGPRTPVLSLGRAGGRVLDGEPRVRTADGETLTTEPGAGHLVDAGSHGFATLPEGRVRARHVERADAPDLLAVMRPGRGLELRSLEDGRTLAELRWPAISACEALDLDGDGTQELLVASGDRLTALALGDRENRTKAQISVVTPSHSGLDPAE